MPSKTWHDLTAFQRDVLEAIGRIERADGRTYGLAIKRDLERLYNEEVNHGRLYPNLDDLVDAGLVEKGEIDKRTNEYTLSAEGAAMLRHRIDVIEDAVGGRAAADGGESGR